MSDTPRNPSALHLDRAAFRAWLAEQPAGRIVGRRLDAHCCPIAVYITPPTGATSVTAGPEECWFELDYARTERIATPPWAVTFMEAVDGSGASGIGVRASTALRLLDEVPAS